MKRSVEKTSAILRKKGGAVYLYNIMEQFTPSPALPADEASLSGRSNERKRCFRLENIRRYFKRTDKTYLLLCIFSSVMAGDSAFELGSQAGQWLCRG